MIKLNLKSTKVKTILFSIIVGIISNLILSGVFFTSLWITMLIDNKSVKFSPDFNLFAILNIVQIITVTILTYTLINHLNNNN
jgi:hypothetical protein